MIPIYKLYFVDEILFRSCTDEEDFDSNDDLYTRVIDPFSSDNRPHALCAIFYYVMQMPTTTIADMYPKIYFHPGKGPFHSRLVSKTPFQLACDRFKMTKVLGQGSYATVYDVELLNSAYSLPAKHHVALKVGFYLAMFTFSSSNTLPFLYIV